MKITRWMLFSLLFSLLLTACTGVVQGVVYGDIDSSGEIGSLEGPLEGVSVQLAGCGATVSQLTGADGAFDFQEVPDGTCAVQVSKGCWQFFHSFPDLGYPVPVASDPDLPTSIGVLMSPTCGIVRGRIYRDLNGNGIEDDVDTPLEGVTVDLTDCGPALSQVTAPDGFFYFDGLPDGTCHVAVSKAGWSFSNSFPNVGYPIPVASDATLPTSFGILMSPNTGIVQGVVYGDLDGDGVQDEDEVPLAGVEVHLDDCGPSLMQTTADDGAFEFTNLPVGSCTLQTIKAGWGFSNSFPNVGYPIPVASAPTLPTAIGILMSPIADAIDEGTERAAGFEEFALSVDLIYPGLCTPNRVSFEVKAFHPSGIRSVTLFFKVEDPGGEQSPWNAGVSMPFMGDDYYLLTQTADQLLGSSDFDEATVLYQFVLEPSDGEFIRSQVFRNLAIDRCGQAPPPPQATATPDKSGPTPTPTKQP